MAGHTRYTALLDACVLHPIAMCGALMNLATTGLFAAKWARRIEVVWIRAAGYEAAHRRLVRRQLADCPLDCSTRTGK